MTVHDGKPDWRSRETFERYQRYRQENAGSKECALCTTESLKEFTHWRLVPNKFPYDRVTEVHNMILPKRHTDGEDLTTDEQSELKSLLQTELNADYNFILQSLPRTMSIPGHIHYHLVAVKNFE